MRQPAAQHDALRVGEQRRLGEQPRGVRVLHHPPRLPHLDREVRGVDVGVRGVLDVAARRRGQRREHQVGQRAPVVARAVAQEGRRLEAREALRVGVGAQLGGLLAQARDLGEVAQRRERVAVGPRVERVGVRDDAGGDAHGRELLLGERGARERDRCEERAGDHGETARDGVHELLLL